MTETKRCGGYRGHWECIDEYPDHMVPVDQFNRDGNKKKGSCRSCHTYGSKINNTQKPHHPTTGQWKMNWKSDYAQSIGGARGTPEWQSYLDKAEAAWPKDATVVDIRPKLKSEFGQSTPMTKRETVKVEGEAVPEGWVYVVRNPDVPLMLGGIMQLKIGKTFRHGIPSIMSSARRFGRAKLMGKFWFEEAYKAEQAVHRSLKEYNLRSQGHTDCGKELFTCTFEEAKRVIENVQTNFQSENDRPSIAVGE